MGDDTKNQATDSGSGGGSSGQGANDSGDAGQSQKTQDDGVSQAVFQKLKLQRDALKGENENLKNRRFVSEEDFSELEKFRSDDVSRQLKDMEAKGEFDQLKAQLTETHTTELKQKDKVIASLRGSLSKEVVDGAILSAASGKAHDPAKVIKLLRGNIILDFNKDDGGHAIKIVDDSGNKVYNDNGDPIGLEDFVVKYLKDNPDLQPSGAVSGSGGNSDTGSGNTGGSVGGKIVGSGTEATRVPTMEEQGRMSLDDIKKKRAELKKAGKTL